VIRSAERITLAARRTTTTAGNRSHDVAASGGMATNNGVGSPMASGALKAATCERSPNYVIAEPSAGGIT
jgi:hypothetical protein